VAFGPIRKAREAIGSITGLYHYRKAKHVPEMSKKTIDLTGQTFGQLLVLAYAGQHNRVTFWTCKCMGCGSIRDYRGGNLRSGRSTACHHCPAKSRKQRPVRFKRPGYLSWKRINRTGEVCKRWRSFDRFIEDMGEPPKGKRHLVRIDPTKPFKLGNCEWSSAAHRRLITCNGQTLSVSAWARQLGISHQALNLRLKKLPAHEALTKPVRPKNSRRTG
jgi:hypothetical protein